MATTEIMGIELAPTAKSAILIKEAMAGQPDAQWVALFSILLNQTGDYRNSHYWVEIFQAHLHSKNDYIRYAAHMLLLFRGDDQEALREDSSWLVALVPDLMSFLPIRGPVDGISSRFWSLPEKAQILLVNRIDLVTMCGLFLEAPKDVGSELHLCALIDQWLTRSDGRPGLATNKTGDGWEEYSRESKIGKLWLAIPEFPVGAQTGLIERLPIGFDMEKTVLIKLYPMLNKRSQESLLRRRPVQMLQTRRDWFEQKDENDAFVALCGEGGKHLLQESLRNLDKMSKPEKLKLALSIAWIDDEEVLERIMLYDLLFQNESLEIDVYAQIGALESIRDSLARVQQEDQDQFNGMIVQIRLINLASIWQSERNSIESEPNYQGRLAPLLKFHSLEQALQKSHNLFDVYTGLDRSQVPNEVLAEFGSTARDFVDVDPFDSMRDSNEIQLWRYRLKLPNAGLPVSEDQPENGLQGLAENVKQIKSTSTLALWGVLVLVVWEIVQYFQ